MRLALISNSIHKDYTKKLMLHARPPWCTLHPLRTLEKPPFLKRRNQSIGEFNILDVRFKISDFRLAIRHQLFAYSPLVQFEIPCYFFTPAAEGHGLWPWMNAPAFGRDVAPLGREVGCHGLCPWGSTVKVVGDEVIDSESYLRFHGTGGCLY